MELILRWNDHIPEESKNDANESNMQKKQISTQKLSKSFYISRDIAGKMYLKINNFWNLKFVVLSPKWAKMII